jgi:hypothetical protein
MVIGYADDRSASMTLMGGQGFQISAKADKDTVVLNDMGDFFPGLIDAMLTFFDTGVSPVPKAETIEIASIVSSGIKALEAPGVWLNID